MVSCGHPSVTDTLRVREDEVCAMPAHGGPSVTFCPLLIVKWGLPDFGIFDVGLLLKCCEKCPWCGGGPGLDVRTWF